MVNRVPVAACLVIAAAGAAASATGFNACNDSVASGALFGKQMVVSTAASEAWSVAVGDFNGDGHLDLASASYGDCQSNLCRYGWNRYGLLLRLVYRRQHAT